MADAIARRLEELENFHSIVIENRRAYFQGEIERLHHEVGRRDDAIATLDEERRTHLRVLETSGALERSSRNPRRNSRTFEHKCVTSKLV